MLRRGSIFVGLVFLLAFPMLSGTALAHHSRASYTYNAVALKGTVVDYVWGNPHVQIIWNVKEDNGNTVKWTGELASITTEIAQGLTKDSLKPGDEILLNVFPAKNGSPYCVVDEIKFPDGRYLVKSRGKPPAEAQN